MKKENLHNEVLTFMAENYYDDTKKLIDKIVIVLDKKNIASLINRYPNDIISPLKKELLEFFLNKKIEYLKNIYYGKESYYE